MLAGVSHLSAPSLLICLPYDTDEQAPRFIETTYIIDSTVQPPTGLWIPHKLEHLYYGPDTVAKHLVRLLPTASSEAYIVTGRSIATTTPLAAQVARLLGPQYADTCTAIRQHAPVADLEAARAAILANPAIDTVVSLGGGSPIDGAKWLSYHVQAARVSTGATPRRGGFLFHIAIPTTLSAAETTMIAGFTAADGIKTAVGGRPELAPHAILYDPAFAQYTPARPWLATGVRALDHTVELLYHPSITEVPGRAMALHAAGSLFRDLPRARAAHPHDAALTVRLFLAAFASLAFLGRNYSTGLGLSHRIGYALGAPYGIPHGETSCIALGDVVGLHAQVPALAEQIARLLLLIKSGAVLDASRATEQAKQVGEEIKGLVRRLGLERRLGEYGVGVDQTDVITRRATDPAGRGSEMEPAMVEAVRRMVRGFFDKGPNI